MLIKHRSQAIFLIEIQGLLNRLTRWESVQQYLKISSVLLDLYRLHVCTNNLLSRGWIHSELRLVSRLDRIKRCWFNLRRKRYSFLQITRPGRQAHKVSTCPTLLKSFSFLPGQSNLLFGILCGLDVLIIWWLKHTTSSLDRQNRMEFETKRVEDDYQIGHTITI